MIDFPAHSISDGCIVVLSTHERKDRVINRPQAQVFQSAYNFQRSFLHTHTTLQNDIRELQRHGITLNLQVTDNLPATEEEEQAMHAALSSVIEKIEGQTRKETYQALQQLTAAAQTQDRKGRKNPPAKRLQLVSGRDRLEQGTISVIQKKATIASYEDIFAKMLKEHETRLFKMKEIINYFRATYHFPYPKEKIQLLVQKLESKIPDRKNELPVIKPFSIYYTTLEKELQKLKTQMDHSHYDDIPKILDNMDYILHHFAVLQSVETFWYDRLQTPDTDKTAFLKTFWENHQSFLKQYTERLAQGQEKGKKNKFVDQWNEFMTLLEDFVTNINENDLCALCIRLDTIFNSQFIQYL
jgi:ribosome-associated translation inhibitor RaiA